MPGSVPVHAPGVIDDARLDALVRSPDWRLTMTLKLTLATAVSVVTMLVTAGSAFAAPGVTTGGVNLREGPGTEYDIIDHLNKGKFLDIIECDGGWCEVEVDGDEGYVSASYLALIEDEDDYDDEDDEDHYDDDGPSVEVCLGGGGFGGGGFGFGEICIED
jgi:hypothetical protein